MTRKLRRRPNDPTPVLLEKRRKPPTAQLVLLLDDKEIEMDLKLIARGKPLQNLSNGNNNNNSRDRDRESSQRRTQSGMESYTILFTICCLIINLSSLMCFTT